MTYDPPNAGAGAARDAAPAPGGEMAALIRDKDWAASPVGARTQWSPALRMIVDFMLANQYPMLLWWGPDYISLYNDAYRPVLGTKHPWALGVPFQDVWSEIDQILRPLIDAPFNGGPATWMDDIQLEINRFGYLEETHFTVSYSPVPDDTAPRGIGGVMATVQEMTQKIVGERRMEALRDLGTRAGGGRAADEACALATLALQRHDKDIPFTMAYLLDADGKTARLAASAGAFDGQLGRLSTIVLDDEEAVWPFAEVRATKAPVTVSRLASRLSPTPPGPWSDPPHTAVVLPLGAGGTQALTGFLVAGVSPRLPLDEQYRSFLDLVAAQVSAAIASARAYEQERRRAEALMEIDRAKTLFFSNISHEFRTPLSLIIGPLTDALGGKDGMARSQLELVHRNALRLLKLVNSLLDFSRIEAGRAKAVYVPTDLAQLSCDLASNFRSACERAGLTLTLDCPPLSAPVYVDRDKWEKIVLNLLSNAFKFTLTGGIAVALHESGGHAALTVRDTGVGIPENEIGRVFERFHRIEGQKSRTHEGSGIGLALVQELVNLHGGSISVESAVGRGTAFTVTMPLGSADLMAKPVVPSLGSESTAVKAAVYVEEALRWLPGEGDGDAEADPFDAPAAAALLPRGGDLVLADDNADMRAYVRRLLGSVCDVRAVADGKAALKEIRSHRPDLVIADVMMPEMDGFALLREIRGDPALRDIPVILLSARAGEESRVDGLDAGANDYLVKPFSARELIARVGTNLEIARVRSEGLAALRALAESLDTRVHERTAELEQANRKLVAEMEQRQQTEMALRQAQKLEAIGRLTGGVAHDFNNLLMVVHGGINILERGADGPRRERVLNGMRQAAARGEALTQQLLVFSRNIELRAEAIDLGKLVDGMRILIAGALRGDIEVQIRVPADLWLTLADPTQLELAILNAVVNARDAMPNGGTVTIRARNVVLDGTAEGGLRGDFVRVEIEDTGVGIPAEILHRVFDPFFTTKPIGKGTGLGLSQVYGFAQQSGGHAHLLSKVGQGTILALDLPRADAQAHHTAAVPSEAPQMAGNGRKVLLVEDNDDVAALEGDMLDVLGFIVTRVANAGEALATLSGGMRFDLILSDIVMPGGTNGIDLAKQIRGKHPDVPILLTTGYSEALGNAQGVGFRILRKPYSLDNLEETLRSILG